MKTIIIACAGGMTSSLLCTKVIKAAINRGIKAKFDSVELLLRCEEKQLKALDYELLVLYAPVSALDERNADIFKKYINLVLIAPQVGYMEPMVKANLEKEGLPYKLIDKKQFGLMDGEGILNSIEDVILNK
ncbi:PTS sugar transporter subunit IIB [Desnuesiella massiliensis]|uniref:PTS sugar transporter subunit IIB n=1 Tax=Desnuesiella massiliensis TaxID=1650662 RepID=UPI0006E2960A|nr:hypothetical protein [Desnuesiella massiliensis]